MILEAIFLANSLLPAQVEQYKEHHTLETKVEQVSPYKSTLDDIFGLNRKLYEKYIFGYGELGKEKYLASYKWFKEILDDKDSNSYVKFLALDGIGRIFIKMGNLNDAVYTYQKMKDLFSEPTNEGNLTYIHPGGMNLFYYAKTIKLCISFRQSDSTDDRDYFLKRIDTALRTLKELPPLPDILAGNILTNVNNLDN